MKNNKGDKAKSRESTWCYENVATRILGLRATVPTNNTLPVLLELYIK